MLLVAAGDGKGEMTWLGTAVRRGSYTIDLKILAPREKKLE